MITVFAGLLIAVGFIMIVVPVLPGLPVMWAGVLIWALGAGSTGGWITLGLASMFIIAGYLVEYLVPARRMRRAGVRTSTLVVGVLVAIVGFFVIPVVGLFLGFPVGIYLVERVRRQGHPQAWTATKHALKAVGLNILIELTTGAVVIVTWVAALLLLR